MALTAKNWTVNSYTNDTWTDLVAEVATVAAIIVSSTVTTTISIRLEDGGTELAVIAPTSDVDSNGSYTLDVRSLNITAGQSLQVKAAAAGVNFTASGVV